MRRILLSIVVCALVSLLYGLEEVHLDLLDLLSDEELEEVEIDSVGGVDSIEDKEDMLECTLVRDLTPGRDATTTQECCKVPTDEGSFEVKCLPSFVIAGTQKSGTTVLSAYLANHQDISFARKKELHYFSNDKYYRKGLVDGYLNYFRKWNYTEPAWRHRPPIYGEATPYYLASRKACSRMAQVLGSNTKLIVLLREPVARAYSEYQMKERRVRQQADFIQVCQTHSREIYACLSSEDSVSLKKREGAESRDKLSIKWKTLKKCLPSAVKEHFHWSKFVSALEDHVSKADSIDTVMQACFATLSLSSDSESDERPTSEDKDSNDDNGVPQFQAKACLKKHAKERLPSLEEAFFGEIEDFHLCAQNETTEAVPPGRFHSHNVDSPDALDNTVERCLHVKSGISNQYVYRSLYAVQIYHCLKSFDRGQILVLPSERLRSNPRETVAQALRFVGAEPGSYPDEIAIMGEGEVGEREGNSVGADAITRAVKEYFPVFEKNTGWRLYGDYPALDQAQATRLRNYFRPFNEMLFTLLGERFTEWEDPEALEGKEEGRTIKKSE